MAELGDAELELDLPSLSMKDDFDLSDPKDEPQPPSDAAVLNSTTEPEPAVETSVIPSTITWHEDVKDESKRSASPSSLSPPAAATLSVPSSASLVSTPQPADTSASRPITPTVTLAPPHPATAASVTAPPPAPVAADLANLIPSTRSAASSLSVTGPTHQTRPSLIAFDGVHSTVNLSALGPLDPLEYLRMFRAILTLQHKCRQWRVRIKERIRQKVEDERARQESELQLKLHNIKQQKKHSQALHQQRGSMSRPAAPRWSVELPADQAERLRFTVSMMKIQRMFRAKLARARLRLVEKLKKEKDEQEREMRERIEKRQRRRRQLDEEQLQAGERKDEGVAESKEQMVMEQEVKKQLSLPLQQLEVVKEQDKAEDEDEPLRGTLTSRLRRERQKRLEQEEKPRQEEKEEVRTMRSVDVHVQVDAEELRQTAALQAIPSLSLYVPIDSPSAVPDVPLTTLHDQHLQLMAALSTLSTVGKQTALAPMGAAGSLAFVTLGEAVQLRYVSAALCKRVFGVSGVEDDGGAGGMEADEDWESVIHLPLPLWSQPHGALPNTA